MFRILFTAILIFILSLSKGYCGDFALSEKYINDIGKKHGEYAKRRVRSWQKLINDSKDLSEQEKLQKVNSFFNLMQFRSDIANWGQIDYWATPLEFLIRGAGDCEDYSIAKFFTLIEVGVDEAKLQITYVKALELDQAHMVLTYYETPSAIPVVLDNLNPEILAATQRKDLQPVYSFNGAGLWLAKERGKGKRLGESGELKLWKNFTSKLRKEASEIKAK